MAYIPFQSSHGEAHIYSPPYSSQFRLGRIYPARKYLKILLKSERNRNNGPPVSCTHCAGGDIKEGVGEWGRGFTFQMEGGRGKGEEEEDSVLRIKPAPLL